MAVLVEALSVIVRTDSLLHQFSGGWQAFECIIPNQTICTDHEIVRVGFMTPQDVGSYVEKLKGAGLEFVRAGEAIDIAVVDQITGITSKCTWLEFGQVDLNGEGQCVSACRLAGSHLMHVVTPQNWTYEGSISSTCNFVPTENIAKELKYLRHENGRDVYLDLNTGKEMYVGRSGMS
jgi:hypothetical protein